MSKTLDLKKIKLGKNSVELVYLDFVQVGEDTYTKEVGELCYAPPTTEFKIAVRAMEGFVQDIVPLERNKVEKLTVTQISITDEDDGLGIVMSVTAKFKKSSRPLNFNTPYWSTLDNENPLPEAAVEAVETIKEQAKEYSGGTYEQASLDLTTDEKPDDDQQAPSPGYPSESEESESVPGQETSEDGRTHDMNGKKPKRKRRTKLEMEKARAEEQEAAEATV